MKDGNGNYWCLHDDGHFHTEDHCPNDFKSQNRHKFRVVKNKDNNKVPSGKCAIQSAYDDSFLKMTDKLEQGNDNDLDETDYQFVVKDVGSGEVSIFSVKENKYLKLDGHHAKAKENSDCGNACHFTVEEIDTLGILMKMTQKIGLKSILFLIFFIVLHCSINIFLSFVRHVHT